MIEMEVLGSGTSTVGKRTVNFGETYFHGNLFKETAVPQHPDNSTTCREATFARYSPMLSRADALRFLGDSSGPWPVFRNATPPDDW